MLDVSLLDWEACGRPLAALLGLRTLGDSLGRANPVDDDDCLGIVALVELTYDAFERSLTEVDQELQDLRGKVVSLGETTQAHSQ